MPSGFIFAGIRRNGEHLIRFTDVAEAPTLEALRNTIALAVMVRTKLEHYMLFESEHDAYDDFDEDFDGFGESFGLPPDDV